MSVSKEPNFEIVMTPGARFNDVSGKWQPSIKVGIHAFWIHGYPVTTAVIYCPDEFDSHFKAEVFAKQLIEDTNV